MDISENESVDLDYHGSKDNVSDPVDEAEANETLALLEQWTRSALGQDEVVRAEVEEGETGGKEKKKSKQVKKGEGKGKGKEKKKESEDKDRKGVPMLQTVGDEHMDDDQGEEQPTVTGKDFPSPLNRPKFA